MSSPQDSVNVAYGSPSASAGLALSACLALIAVSVGRLTELIPILAPLKLGFITPLFAIVALVISPRNSLGRLTDTRITTPLLVFSLLVAVSLFYSIYKSRSLWFIQYLLPINILLYIVLVKSVQTVNDLRKVAYVAIISAAVFSVKAVTLDWMTRVEVESKLDPNDLANFLCCVLPFIAAEISLVSRNSAKITLIGIAAISILTIFLTQSRGGFLALSAITMVFLFSRGFGIDSISPSTKQRFKRLLVLGIVALVLFQVVPDASKERLLSFSNYTQDYNVTYERGGRVGIWKRGLSYLASHPWGSGVESYQVVDMNQGGQFRDAHNSFVQVAVEIGVVGFFFYVLTYARSFSIVRSTSQSLSAAYADSAHSSTDAHLYAYSQASLISLIAFCVSGFFLSLGYSPLVYLLFGIIGCIERFSKQRESSNVG